MTQPAIRPATLEDAALAADLMTASYPAFAEDPVITRFRWEHPREGFEWGRYIAELDGHPIAYMAWVHGPWDKLPERHGEVEVWLDRAAMDIDRLQSLWESIGMRAVEAGARMLLAYAAEDEPEMLEALHRDGYARDRLDKAWELDMTAHRMRLLAEAAESRERAGEAGFTLTTLAGWSDPARIRKLHELSNRTVQDVPHTLPILPESLADFEHRINGPDRPHDRYWVALHRGEPVALSYLRYPPVRGSVWTGYTCSHPDYRGRGLARAIKLQSLAQAIGLGVPMVYTDNDSENAPMLHINERLGYDRRPGFVAHLKRVKT